MKTCGTCKEDKNESEFYSKGKENRLYSQCKTCFNTYVKKRWSDRKLEAIQYKGGECNKCKQKFHYSVYDFHHREPKEKDCDWVKLRLKSWKSVLLELDKCDLLCANCHRITHYENGVTGGT
jgi:hypothetical protein